MTHTATLPVLLKQLRLSTMAQEWKPLLIKAQAEQWSGAQYLATLCEQELHERYSRRIARFMKESRLPLGKTLGTFNFDYVPNINIEEINALANNKDWVYRLLRH